MTEQTTNPTMTQPPPAASRPPLRRSEDRVLGGVAGGVARWLDVDPVLVRVVTVVLAVFGGTGLLLYAAGWLLIPDAGTRTSPAQQLLDRSGRPGSANRVLLIVLGACFAALAVAWIGGLGIGRSPWDFVTGGTMLLLLTGALVVWLLVRDGRTASAPAPTATNETAPAAPRPDPAAAAASGTAAVAPTAVLPPVPPTPSATPDGAPPPPVGFAYGGAGDYPGYVPVPPAPPAPRPPRRRSYLGLAVLSIAVLVMGAMTALNVADVTEAIDIPVVVILATGLGILGIGMLVGAFAGRATWLISIAIPMLLLTALVAVVPRDLSTMRSVSIGDARWTPSTVQEASRVYELGIGNAVLDLRDLPDPAALTEAVSAHVGLGRLRVLVPEEWTVALDASVGAGDITITGPGSRQLDGVGRTLRTTLPGTSTTPDNVVDLDLEVGLGSLEVSRD